MIYNVDDFSGTIKDNYTILGWTSRTNGSIKLYLFQCSVCSQDSEMYGEGLFIAHKSSILRGSPCGCSPSYQRTLDQTILAVRRTAVARHHEYIGINYSGSAMKSTLILSCRTHGVWDTTTVNNYLHKDRGCPQCGFINRKLKSDDVWLDRFFNTGSFPNGTIFGRSLDDITRWNYRCGKCFDLVNSAGSHLAEGKLGCSCFLPHQKYLYINLLIENSVVFGFKYGIACRPDDRIRAQSNASVYQMQQLYLYHFDDARTTRFVESLIKSQYKLKTSFVTKANMPLGYTETLPLTFLSYVTTLIDQYGGVAV